ncbi:hypothetical protein HETIRDRAFT_453038 [Heterobasidion irregulare TC 32-1]|uniref:Uncharacterized protein n=1 Tax=Heterobasidion irregulare (strain TC 32-1) TaxID=747525 RepID=W4K3X5_HETIT|nr:uncharacterized protein HETIRDRAFT_453038 [Heterobasidion irregulare TC 32-1]ETW80045.1 hypothetical protein HETIRDRAFT_453038 [Heterobasidion irregulare TC 32-1]
MAWRGVARRATRNFTPTRSSRRGPRAGRGSLAGRTIAARTIDVVTLPPSIHPSIHPSVRPSVSLPPLAVRFPFFEQTKTRTRQCRLPSMRVDSDAIYGSRGVGPSLLGADFCLAGWLAGWLAGLGAITAPRPPFSSLLFSRLPFSSFFPSRSHTRPIDRPDTVHARPRLPASSFGNAYDDDDDDDDGGALPSPSASLVFTRFHRATGPQAAAQKMTEQGRAQWSGLDLPRAPWRGNDIRLARSPQSLGLGRKPLGGGVCAHAGAASTSLRAARARFEASLRRSASQGVVSAAPRLERAFVRCAQQQWSHEPERAPARDRVSAHYRSLGSILVPRLLPPSLLSPHPLISGPPIGSCGRKTDL